jgi:NADPH-dependent curcumin reductase CurA
VDGVNRRWLLRARPEGTVGRESFEWTEEAVPTAGDGQALVRTLWLSCDPAQRTWMERDTYIPVVPLGEPMAASSFGQVVDSRHPRFAPGDFVVGLFGWEDYVVTDGTGFVPVQKVPPGVDGPTALSLFGISGLTAYFGLLDVGRLAPGETVVVSAAAGAVGSTAVQIAKLKGARVVGVAGGPRKCDWVVQELGADAAVDYKGEDVAARLHALCPGGVDVYFDNVGGEVLDAALANLAVGARVVVSGFVSAYGDLQGRPGIRNYVNLVGRRATMQGFLVFDYFPRAAEAVADLGAWAATGALTNHVDVVEGLERAPDALRRLFTGANRGKQLVKVADPPLA